MQSDESIAVQTKIITQLRFDLPAWGYQVLERYAWFKRITQLLYKNNEQVQKEHPHQKADEDGIQIQSIW